MGGGGAAVCAAAGKPILCEKPMAAFLSDAEAMAEAAPRDRIAARLKGLEGAGVTVVERVPHHLPPNPHNERYLATKRDRTGHQL